MIRTYENKEQSRGGAGRRFVRVRHCDGCGETALLDSDHVQDGQMAKVVLGRRGG